MSSKEELAQQLPHWSTWQNNTAPHWWRDKGLRRCMLNIILLYGSILSFGYDGAVISTVQALPYWETYFGAPSGVKLGLIVSAYLFPQCILPFFCARIVDWIGRKRSVTLLCLFGIVGPIVSALGNGLGSFVTGRVLTGVSTAFAFVTAPPFISEIAHPRFRPVVAATLWSSFTIGTFIAGWIGYGLERWESNWSWRLVILLQFSACIPMLPVSLSPYMVESPRWLCKHGRRDEALQVLADLHANGDRQDELVANEFAEIEAALQFESGVRQAPLSEFFVTGGNRHRLAILLFFGWIESMSGQNLLAYYLPIILQMAGFHDPIQIQGIQAGTFANLMVCAFIGGQLVERVGRKNLLRFSLIATAISFILFTALAATFVERGNQAAGIGVVVFSFIVGGAITVGIYPVGLVYMPEILPYHLRTVGLSIFTISTSLGAVYNSLVNPVALDAISWKYYLIFVVGDVLQAIVGWFLLIETKGLTLEDIGVLFDGDQHKVEEINEAVAVSPAKEAPQHEDYKQEPN